MTTPTAKDFVTQAQAAKIALANKPQQSLLAEAIDLAAQKANLEHLRAAKLHLDAAREALETAFLEMPTHDALRLVGRLVASDEILNLIEKKAALIAIVEQNGNTPSNPS